MTEELIQQNLTNQPQSTSDNYVFNQTVLNKESENKSKIKLLRNLYTLLFIIFTILILTIIIFFVLNYFNIIILSKINSSLNNLPTKTANINSSSNLDGLMPYRIQDTNEYRVNGNLQNFTVDSVSIKLADGSNLNLRYDSETQFNEYKTVGSKKIPQVKFPEEILIKKTIGKNVAIQYQKQKDNNYLEELSISQ